MNDSPLAKANSIALRFSRCTILALQGFSIVKSRRTSVHTTLLSGEVMDYASIHLLARLGERFGFRGALFVFRYPGRANGSTLSWFINPDDNGIPLTIGELTRLQNASGGRLTIECMPRPLQPASDSHLRVHVEGCICRIDKVDQRETTKWLQFLKRAVDHWEIRTLFAIAPGSE